MEQKQQQAITSAPIPANNDNIQLPRHGRQKKKGSFLQILKVAIFSSRLRSSKSKVLPVVQDGSDATWGKLVSSVRPLHLPTSQSPPLAALTQEPYHSGEESPASSSQSPVALGLDECSNYASAVGLSDLLEEEGAESPKEEVFCDYEGDEMIDAKAEEFISQFYVQMKMQRMDSMDRRHMRSLGYDLE